MPVGTQVSHINRGAGVIIAYNDTEHGFYNKTKYPYVVQFIGGHSDVYAESDLTSLE